jgi:hypothetical protein
MTFKIYRQPRMAKDNPVATVQFMEGYPMVSGAESPLYSDLREFILDTRSCFFPEGDRMEDTDLTNPAHQRSVMSRVNLLGLEAEPVK